MGHEVARGTIANVLKEQRLEPAPERERKTTWREFLSRHREVIVAADFFTIEAWTRKALTRLLVLFLIDLSSRRVEIAGVAREANGLWMSQVARNLSDAAEGFLTGKRYLIHDRDPLFTAEFLEILEATGVQSVKLPPRSPNLLLEHFPPRLGIGNEKSESDCFPMNELRSTLTEQRPLDRFVPWPSPGIHPESLSRGILSRVTDSPPEGAKRPKMIG